MSYGHAGPIRSRLNEVHAAHDSVPDLAMRVADHNEIRRIRQGGERRRCVLIANAARVIGCRSAHTGVGQDQGQI